MPFEHNIVVGTNIEDAWRNAMWCCIRNGYLYRVAKGSYEGQLRKQLDYVTVRVLDPWKRPLAASTPEGSAIPSPTSEDKIWSYFNEYIIGDQKEEGEDYTYGQYIAPQLSKAVDILNSSKGDTNQSCITIGDQDSINLNSPPCLKVVSFKVVNGFLQMAVYFRSWDLFAGLPENLGGLQLLKEYVLCQLKFNVKDGPIVAFSDGLHLYEQYFPLANALNADKIEIEE